MNSYLLYGDGTGRALGILQPRKTKPKVMPGWGRRGDEYEVVGKREQKRKAQNRARAITKANRK